MAGLTVNPQIHAVDEIVGRYNHRIGIARKAADEYRAERERLDDYKHDSDPMLRTATASELHKKKVDLKTTKLAAIRDAFMTDDDNRRAAALARNLTPENYAASARLTPRLREGTAEQMSISLLAEREAVAELRERYQRLRNDDDYRTEIDNIRIEAGDDVETTGALRMSHELLEAARKAKASALTVGAIHALRSQLVDRSGRRGELVLRLQGVADVDAEARRLYRGIAEPWSTTIPNLFVGTGA